MATDPNPAEKGKVAEMINRLSRYEPLGGIGNSTMHNPTTDPHASHTSAVPLVGIATVSTANGQHPPSSANMPARVGIVRFSYAAQQEDELNLKEGDKLEVLEDVEDGWARGQLLNADGNVSGRTGMFPTNFVSFEDRNKVPSPAIEPQQQQTNGCVTAASDPSVPTPMDSAIANALPSAVRGNQQQYPRHAKSTILSGSAEHTLSAFNSSAGGFTKLGSSGSTSTKEMARVMYQYDAANADELSLPEGAIVTILSKNCEDEGWYEGEYQGNKGLFPENFVRLIESVAASATTPTIAEKQPIAINPPQLPAKPNKAGIQAHHRTTSSGGGPIASVRSDEATVTATLPIVKPIQAREINPPGKPATPSAQPPILPSEIVDRRSMVANLQSILFRDGKLPPKRPLPGSATHANATPNNGGINIHATSPPTTVEPSITDDSDKLTSLTKARPKQTKRPPSMNFRISAPPQLKKPDDSPTQTSMSISVHPQVAAGLATVKADAPAHLKATPNDPRPPPAIIPQQKLEHVDTHSHVPPARPSPPNLTSSPGIALSPARPVAEERAGRGPLPSSNPPSPATLPTPQSTQQVDNEWVSRKEFEKYKEEMEKKLNAISEKISKLSKTD